MKTRLLIIIIAAISVGALSFILSSFQDEGCTSTGRGDENMPILQQFGGKQASTLEEATAIAGHDIKAPKYLPPEYKIRNISISDSRIVILASKYPVTNDTRYDYYVFQDKGIIIYYDYLTEMDHSNFIKSFLDNTPKVWKKFDVNGMPALGYETTRQQDTTACFVAILQFYQNQTSIMITGLFSTDELIKIASGIG